MTITDPRGVIGMVGDGALRTRVFIISTTRIYREGLSHVLAAESAVEVIGTASDVDKAAAQLITMRPDVTLFDLTDEAGLDGVRRLAHREGQKVVVLGVTDDVEQILSCAEAGIAGYVTRNESLAHLVSTVCAAARGEFTCPPQVAGGLLRRLGTLGGQAVRPPTQPSLTGREQEVVRLIGLGLSNKEIAKRLGIQLATVKNHVHNILDKAGVRRRADAALTLRAGLASAVKAVH
jgi:two-component system, NarL family, nitrate/nitrite response regulator NarL